VEENIRLVVLKHLSHELHVHVLDVDLLIDHSERQTVQYEEEKHTWRLLFMTMIDSLSFSYWQSVMHAATNDVVIP
jgi:hypothetical protein